jgi:hypothetical protein
MTSRASERAFWKGLQKPEKTEEQKTKKRRLK